MIIKLYLVLFTSNDADKCLCRKIYNEHHCIHDLLPPRRTSINYLRPKGNSFELPRCALSLELHKNLFYLDVCLIMCSSAICYAWFCTSICIDVMSIKKGQQSIVDTTIDTFIRKYRRYRYRYLKSIVDNIDIDIDI